MTVLTKSERLELILTYYILWKIKKEPRIIRKIIKHLHAPAQAYTFTPGELASSSIADLGTKDHDLLDGLLDDDHTQYLPIDGTTRAMTGVLELVANGWKTPNLAMWEVAADTFIITDDTRTNYRHLAVNTIFPYKIRPYVSAMSDCKFETWGTVTAYWVFRSHTGAAYIDCAKLIGGEFRISRGGDITMLATKSVDAYTNAGYIKLRRLSQSAEPTPETGELLLWRDTDDDKTYLVYEDVDLGGRKIELT